MVVFWHNTITCTHVGLASVWSFGMDRSSDGISQKMHQIFIFDMGLKLIMDDHSRISQTSELSHIRLNASADTIRNCHPSPITNMDYFHS